jgi:putative transferase (TIGR04331 family)
MKKKIRHLITTADERSWKFDRPVLFLNEWCRLYDRKSVWEGMDAVVSDPYELKSEQQKKNVAYIQELTGQLLIELSAALNLHHNTNHTLRYWNILLGHWLERYVCIIFDRYYTLDQALSNYEVVATTVLKTSEYSLATTDSLSAIWACNNDIWNHVLCARILSFLGGVEIQSKSIETEAEQRFNLDSDVTSGRSFSIKNTIRIITKNITPIFRKQDDAFITSTYLPKWREVGLQLALRQFPQIWQSPPLQTATLNRAMRQSLSVGDGSHTGFERFLRLQLPEMIPICYLEGYNQLCLQVTKLPWPSSPKFIFTSNNFDTDEIFKAWTGLKVEQGVPYFVGQHGANYGTFYASEKFPVAVTCDKFFTWGWTNNNPKNVPAFIFKNAGKKETTTSKDGGLLLIQLPALHRSGLADINAAYSDFSKYYEEQFQFVEALPEKIQNKLTVRLHSVWRKFRWFEDLRWNDRCPSVRIETGAANIQTLISKSRLVVQSYDSTGILETLASNIPIVCFWYGGLNHVLPNAKPYYELLRGAGILADSPEHAALLVAQYWDNIDGWWKSEQVQNARRLFCEQYARNEKHPVRTMKQLLNNQVSDFNIQNKRII